MTKLLRISILIGLVCMLVLGVLAMATSVVSTVAFEPRVGWNGRYSMDVAPLAFVLPGNPMRPMVGWNT